MKTMVLFAIKATATTDGTKKSERATAKKVKDALKAVSIDDVKLVVKETFY